ncbi:MAG: hypothetical protein CR981_00775 [Proteobacteria bacterium]|nr:MAG: hypothetical protein CR981_00775 [Pseudomonadota bacterium]PIE65241.1 MAG: hypothetical protein CSA26_03995 [Desulfobacterales bacterium]
MVTRLDVRCVVSGKCSGQVIATTQSISFWGVVDPHTGTICDPRHELFGQSVSGKVLVFPEGKGSSTGSLIMLELVRRGKAPAAIVNVVTEPILATGPIVCKHFYKQEIPVVTIDRDGFAALQTGQTVTVDSDKGWITIEK